MSELELTQLRARLSDFLKSRSFKSRRQNWYRHANGVWQVVDLQKSLNKPEFTLNFGITADVVLKREGETNLAKNNWAPDSSSCMIQARIGQLIGLGDHWWPLDCQSHSEFLASLGPALLWLDRYTTPESLRDHFLGFVNSDSGRMTLQWAAMLLAELGPIDELTRILRLLKHTRYFDIEEFCSKQGLEVPAEVAS